MSINTLSVVLIKEIQDKINENISDANKAYQLFMTLTCRLRQSVQNDELKRSIEILEGHVLFLMTLAHKLTHSCAKLSDHSASTTTGRLEIEVHLQTIQNVYQELSVHQDDLKTKFKAFKQQFVDRIE